MMLQGQVIQVNLRTDKFLPGGIRETRFQLEWKETGLVLIVNYTPSQQKKKQYIRLLLDEVTLRYGIVEAGNGQTLQTLEDLQLKLVYWKGNKEAKNKKRTETWEQRFKRFQEEEEDRSAKSEGKIGRKN